jgi:cytochrome c-type biogenesis protein CcmH/NrfF
MNPRWAWAALIAVVVVTIGWVSWPSGAESADARAERLASELRCVECEGLSVADAATSTARATRAEIRERIAAGESDGEILQAYVDRYGEWALMNPTGDGVGMIVWVLPVVVVGAGAGGIALALWRSRRSPRLVATPADEELVGAGASTGSAPRAGAGEETFTAEPAIDGDTLEAERDFLVRSIADLDAEYADSDIDAETYSMLRTDYTARTAAVLRALEGDARSHEREPELSWVRRVVVIGSIVAFAAVAGVTLALALGARLPGGLPTGDDVVGMEEREERLRQAVADNPDDPSAHLALADFLVQRDDFAGALVRYDTAARLDPSDPVPLAQAGWLVFLTASSTSDPDQHEILLSSARERLDAAVTIDPDHPDARFYRGVLLLRGFDDPQGAAADLQRFLVLAPEHPLADQVRAVLAEATDTPP